METRSAYRAHLVFHTNNFHSETVAVVGQRMQLWFGFYDARIKSVDMHEGPEKVVRVKFNNDSGCLCKNRTLKMVTFVACCVFEVIDLLTTMTI